MKLGLLGGTFNPPHLGHLRLAEEVACEHGLDRVVFIPCFSPPHKHTGEIAPSTHRMEMTRRACLDNPMFEASEFEIQLKGPSYTVNTLQAFATNSNADIFFILGTDSLREIHTWKDYEKLFSLAHFIVVTRPGIQFLDAWLEVPHVLRDRFRIERDHFVHAGSTVLVPSKVVGLNISSTQIRALLRQGRSIRYLVTDPVWSYIVENHLYGS